MLGPARFNHIETCAREASRVFRVRDDIEESVITLKTLDDLLASLREELASLTEARDTSGSQQRPVKKKQDYADLLKTLDLPKAKRLVIARENAIKSVKTSLKKAKDAKDVTSGP